MSLEFNSKYPDCRYRFTHEIGNGECLNDEVANSVGCLYDGGDCEEFNNQYPGCKATDPGTLGDGTCYPIAPNNTPECGYDGGDCEGEKQSARRRNEYLNMLVAQNFIFIPEFNSKFPDCVPVPNQIDDLGNGRCDGTLNTPECGYEDGDCLGE